MLFAVLFFEDRTEQTIRQIWHALTESNIQISGIDKDVSPHVTLGMFKESHSINLPLQMESFASQFKPLPINMSHYGFFTTPHRIIYLGVTMTDPLYQLHRGLYQQLADELDTTALFVPATYVPHCTLAYDLQPEKLAIALDICQQFPLPIITVAKGVALVESESGQTIHEYPFQTTT